jgi:tetratricopeptide (TPR) repeat protein
LAGVIHRTLIRSQPSIARLNLAELGRWDAVDLLNHIGESLNKEGFRFTTRSTLLCTSLKTRILACHYTAAIVFSLGQEVGLPLAMQKVPSHVFLRLRLRDGEDLNWDIYLKDNGIDADDNYYRQLYRIDRQTVGRGRYLCGLTRHEMLALEYNALGIAWTTKGELDRAVASFTTAIALDSRSSESFKNRGSAKYHRAAKMPRNEEAQREELYSAIADLQEAVKINNAFAEALYSLGLLYYALNEVEAARHFLSAAEKLDPSYYRSELFMALNEKRPGSFFPD